MSYEKLFEMLGSYREKTKDLSDLERKFFDLAQDTWDHVGADYLAATEQSEMTGTQLQNSMIDYWWSQPEGSRELEKQWYALSAEERARLLDLFYPPNEIYSY